MEKEIAIEICYSKSGGPRFTQAEKLAAKFIAFKLKEKGWGIDKVKKHQDFSEEYCPHRTLDDGWTRFLNMVELDLNETNKISDITGHWAEKEIREALDNGWIEGYPDGTFRPDQAMTRAEAVVLMTAVMKTNPVIMS